MLGWGGECATAMAAVTDVEIEPANTAGADQANTASDNMTPQLCRILSNAEQGTAVQFDVYTVSIFKCMTLFTIPFVFSPCLFRHSDTFGSVR